MQYRRPLVSLSFVSLKAPSPAAAVSERVSERGNTWEQFIGERLIHTWALSYLHLIIQVQISTKLVFLNIVS